MTRITTYLFLILAAALPFAAIAQRVEARIDRSEMRIGEQALLELSCDIPKKGTKVEFPALEANLVEGVEIVSKSGVDTIMESDGTRSLRLSQTLHITSFDSGYYAIPPFEFKIEGNVVKTEAFLLTITTMELDSTAAPRPEQGIYTVDVSILDYLQAYSIYIYGSLGALVLLGLIIFLFQRWKKNRVITIPEPEPQPLPQPHISALLALEELKREKAHLSGDIKGYYTRLTDIVREYLEKRFGVLAHELTSRQIISQLAYQGVSEKDMVLLRPLLFRADMVKFAKAKPDLIENEQSIDDAIRFVQHTADADQSTKQSVDV